MITMDEVKKTGMAINLVTEIIDKDAPKGQDWSPEYDYGMRAPFYILAHSGIENGLKALIRRKEGEHPQGHTLRKLFRRLKGRDSKNAKLLEDAFTDIVNFYNIDLGQLESCQSLDAYFKEYGSEDRFETYRYWALENKDLEHVPLFIQRELLVFLGRLCQLGKSSFTSERVESIVNAKNLNVIQAHINPCRQCKEDNKNILLKPELDHSLKSLDKISCRLMEAYNRNFENDDNECADSLTRALFEELKNSDDPAVEYYFNRLTDLPAGSVSPLSDVELEVDEHGVVKVRNGARLGLVYQTIDSVWCIQNNENRAIKYAKTKTDAINWLATECTELVQVSLDGGPLKSMRIMSRPSLFNPDWNDSRVGYKMMLLKDEHGLAVGQHIKVRRGPQYAEVLDGIICKISGREVFWEIPSFKLMNI